MNHPAVKKAVSYTHLYSEQYDNEKNAKMDGYAGLFGVAMDKFQMKIA